MQKENLRGVIFQNLSQNYLTKLHKTLLAQNKENHCEEGKKGKAKREGGQWAVRAQGLCTPSTGAPHLRAAAPTFTALSSHVLPPVFTYLIVFKIGSLSNSDSF